MSQANVRKGKVSLANQLLALRFSGHKRAADLGEPRRMPARDEAASSSGRHGQGGLLGKPVHKQLQLVRVPQVRGYPEYEVVPAWDEAERRSQASGPDLVLNQDLRSHREAQPE